MCGEILSADEVERLLSTMSDKVEKPYRRSEYADRNEILTQSEMEHILSMISGDKPPSQPQFNFETQEQESVAKRVDKDVMRKLQLMHDRLARRFAAKISKMLQSIVDVRLITVDQLLYSEFVFGCGNPTCYNLIGVKSSVKYVRNGNMILDISPVIIYPMIERMLGGGVEPSVPSRRPLTNIEWKLTQRIIDVLFEELYVVWKDIIDLEFSIAQQESNPQLIRFAESNAPMVIICFDVSLIDQRSCMALCIPVELVKFLIEGE